MLRYQVLKPYLAFNRTAYGIEMLLNRSLLYVLSPFNRTAYGIEIVYRAFSPPVRLVAFNRTAYGIEIVNVIVILNSQVCLLIAPLMELKFVSVSIFSCLFLNF